MGLLARMGGVAPLGLAAMLGGLSSGPASAQEGKSIRYDFSPKKKGRILVTASFPAAAQQRVSLVIDKDFDPHEGIESVTAHDNRGKALAVTRRNAHWFDVDSLGRGFRLRYVVVSRKPLARPHIGSDWFCLEGRSILLAPSSGELAGVRTLARVVDSDFADVVTSWNPTLSFSSPADVRNTLCIGGALRRYPVKIGNARVTVAIQGRALKLKDTAFVDAVEKLLRAQSDYMGSLPDSVLLAVLSEGPKDTIGGTALRHAAVFTADPRFALNELYGTVSHELFHLWLGLAIRMADQRTVWFHEGFTTYLGNWFPVAAGLLPPSAFVEEARTWQRRTSRAELKVKKAFADPQVFWRSSPELESLAYNKGALLAFALDAELRRRRSSVAALLRSFYRRRGRVYRTADIEAWFKREGLGAFFDNHLRTAELPPLDTIFASAGFEQERQPLMLAYTGIRIDGDGDFGGIVAIDPQGPMAKADLRPGDRIGGFSFERGSPREGVEIDASVKTTYRWGLARLDPAVARAFLHTHRGTEEKKLRLRFRAMPGGHRSTVIAPPGFFVVAR